MRGGFAQTLAPFTISVALAVGLGSEARSQERPQNATAPAIAQRPARVLRILSGSAGRMARGLLAHPLR